jgi:hypothetical protein
VAGSKTDLILGNTQAEGRGKKKKKVRTPSFQANI